MCYVGIKGQGKVSQGRQEMSESNTEITSWSFRNGLSGVHRFCALPTANDGAWPKGHLVAEEANLGMD